MQGPPWHEAAAHARNPEIARRVESLKKILKRCVLCPRMCRVDRMAGEQGFCRLDARMVISSALPHHGEEPPLSGSRGAGTIFFSSCNLKCIYCQNYQISHSPAGRPVAAEELAGIMLDLEARGCHNVEPVTPTPHLAGIMEALGIARERGLRVPFVFNCGGYERQEILRLIDGMVEIYLPDFKYGLDEAGNQLLRRAGLPAPCAGLPPGDGPPGRRHPRYRGRRRPAGDPRPPPRPAGEDGQQPGRAEDDPGGLPVHPAEPDVPVHADPGRTGAIPSSAGG